MSDIPVGYKPSPSDEPETPSDDFDAGQGPARDILVNLTDKAVLWHDPDGNTFATISLDAHSEN